MGQHYYLRFPGGKLKAVTLSYDDGVKADLRLAEILDRYGMKGTFNINTHDLGEDNPRKTTVAEMQNLLDRGHELAVHGDFHLAPGVVSPTVGIIDVLDCRRALETSFGRIIRGMAYPNSGIRYFCNGSDYGGVRSYLSQLGIAYARALAGDNNSFMLPTDFYAWMPTAKHTNPALMEWTEEFLNIKEEELPPPRKHPRLFYVWGHSYEFDNDNNWGLIENFCARISGKEDTWYATNIEICDYVAAYHSMQVSAEGDRFYNPTATMLWIAVERDIYSIAPGETLWAPRK
ncbi:MAG: polysaccharide deacetylase [Ruminococcaceae bacterium]|nr:polysaccharide deacetylase [Oscillospiraceae bacterium]